ncbi:MAG: Glutamate synthase alpha subunit [Methanomicrobiales archaeon 53_19]|jgi:glutamate synthase domain-containing protein 3|uniref:GltB/FmdC/FwdC-like GXGXG domain-containing protein n=1 Tax=Methanocalculus sp. TaxID=2004547 RepID=UPI0007463D9A|nr:hypothetical protein [Methanocalculus sp.]KUK69937.1 MAG: Glutamate synthase alpha subunit [Methanocalculus sp. 52_23]KUL04590.1 MAG: Glutamate synthase alpha subunit [Methanomicrobiales archaeon 53_19]HIJ06812.1 hypothetical protein [Methanocalculus sp.]
MGEELVINADGIHYTPLNTMIRSAVARGVEQIRLENILGQRFIGNGLKGKARITVCGTPGGDLGMFMSGPTIEVFGNCDHAPGNTMDAGEIIIHGNSGDATAHSMRGGLVMVEGDIGYRGGIHMKEYGDHRPVLIAGGNACSFLGEYMAGGVIIILGCRRERCLPDRGVGTGIHGGEIFIRGTIPEGILGVGAKQAPATDEDMERIKPLIQKYAGAFSCDEEPLLSSGFTRITPASGRPFANKYTWE